MTWRRFGAGIAAAGTLAGAGTAAVDSEINPYQVSDEKYELASRSTIEAAGENKVEAHRDRPAVTLSKWNGEAAMTVAYRAINAEGERQFLTERVEWKGAAEEMHAYPLPAGEGMEDGGFEIEIVLNEKPTSNVFEFEIEGADELDFFYQRELTPEEIADGAERPENVIGSYAVYHKTKANHRVGDTNYVTGKAYHIYRPKAIDANGVEQWAELHYSEGLLTVIVPQEFLYKATYPVRVDPTFGYTTQGASTKFIENFYAWGQFTAPESGTVTKLTAYIQVTSVAKNGIGGLYTSLSLVSNGQTQQVNSAAGTAAFVDYSYVTPPTITSGVDYQLLITASSGSGTFIVNFDTGGTSNATARTYDSTAPATVAASNESNLISIYATYTADAPPASAPQDDTYFEVLD